MQAPKGGYPNNEERYPIDEAIRRLAPSRATVLLVGGSGYFEIDTDMLLSCTCEIR